MASVDASQVKNQFGPVGVFQAVDAELVEGDAYHRFSLMAGALTGFLPVAILYSFSVEHSVSSMTGAVKA